MSRVALFWAAFILTRPLGAMLGDVLDKPRDDGGFGLSRPIASAVIAGFVIACVLLLPKRAGAIRPARTRSRRDDVRGRDSAG